MATTASVVRRVAATLVAFLTGVMVGYFRLFVANVAQIIVINLANVVFSVIAPSVCVLLVLALAAVESQTFL